jgi:hypothetical protein
MPSISMLFCIRWLHKRRNQSGEHCGRVLARVKAILKLFGIFMQMLFGNMHVSGADAAFQMLPKVFQAVHMRTIQDIFLLIVVNYFVGVALLFQIVIGNKFIRVRSGTFLNVFLNDRMQGFDFAVRHNLRHYLTFALEHSEDNGFVFRAATATHTVRLSADIGFVNFDIAKQGKFAVNIFHVLTNQMRHAPSRLVSYTKLAFQFLCGNAVAGSGEQVNGIEPKLQRCAAILERRADCRMQMMPAPLAGVSTLGLKPKPPGCLAAFWADMALPKADIEQVFKALLIFRKAGQKLTDCWAVFQFLLCRFHASNIAQTATYVKGIIPKKDSLFF